MTRSSFRALRRLSSVRWQTSCTAGCFGAGVVGPGALGIKTGDDLWLSSIFIDRSRGRLPDVHLSQHPFVDVASWARSTGRLPGER